MNLFNITSIMIHAGFDNLLSEGSPNRTCLAGSSPFDFLELASECTAIDGYNQFTSLFNLLTDIFNAPITLFILITAIIALLYKLNYYMDQDEKNRNKIMALESQLAHVKKYLRLERRLHDECKDDKMVLSFELVDVHDKLNLLNDQVEVLKENQLSPYDKRVYCEICTSKYSDEDFLSTPRVLDCGHTICLNCSYNLVDFFVGISCPFCREITDVDVHHVDLLKRNWSLLSN